jgi:MFS family permease
VTAERRAELTYLLASVPVRLVAEGTRVALALAAAQTLHDIAIGAALIAVFTAPSVVAAPLIGGSLDAVRSPRRAMLVAALLLAGVLALTAFLGAVPLPLVLLALFVGGCALPMFLGGLSSFVPDVMPGDIARGYAMDALSYNIAGVAGPAVVAAASGLVSPQGALLALVVLTLLGGLALQVLPAHGHGASARPGDLLRGIAAGTRHMATHPPLARATTAGAISQIGGGATPVVAVALALALGADAGAGGWLLTGFAIGGIVGAALAPSPPVARWLATVPPHVTMAAGLAATGVFTLAAAVTPGYALTLAAFVLAGLPVAPTVAAMLRIRQEESPEQVRAQVFTVGAGLRVAASALGAALVGLATHLPAALLIALVAVPWLASALVLVPGRRHPRAAAA